MSHRHFPIRVALLVCLLSASPAVAQQGPAAEQAQVLVLGMYHFANPGLDVVRTEMADVLDERKQAEVRELVEALARFRPTRIAVEHLPGAAPRLDSLYAAYRSGAHALAREEGEQVGFRLAAALGHERVFPVDHRGEFPFGAVMEYAQTHDPAFLQAVQTEIARMTEEMNRLQRESTIAEILRIINAPDRLAADHANYIGFARVGAGDSQVGADLLAHWYGRNIRIFSNLQAITRPGDRVLLLIGVGHAPILRELVRSDPSMRLVEVDGYLP